MNSELNNNALKFTEDKGFVNWVNSGFSIDNDKWQPLRNDVKTQGDIHEAIDLVEMLKFDVSEFPSHRKKDLFNRINDTTQKLKLQ